MNAKWLYAWLLEPRHYNSVTRMPYNRFKDQLAIDGKTVVRSADQLRADLVAYLLSFKDPDVRAAIEDPMAKPVVDPSTTTCSPTSGWSGWASADPTDPTKGITARRGPRPP